MSAVYLFHQRMFSDQNARRRAARLDPADFSALRPLRLVAFDALPRSLPGFDAWFSDLGRSFEVRRTDSYLIQPGKPGEDWLRDAYEVVELTPRAKARPVAIAPLGGPPRRLRLLQIGLATEDGPSYSER